MTVRTLRGTPAAELLTARNHLRRASQALSRFRNQWPHPVHVRQAAVNSAAALEEALLQVEKLRQQEQQEPPW